jgi:hypothetical protein
VDSIDNCPNLFNDTQVDTDDDGKGDPCDACAEPNPGNTACPTTVYAVKQGLVSGPVSVTNLLVTAVGPTGFFAQTVAGDASHDDVLGTHYSAVFVYTGTTGTKPAPGDRVDISTASAINFYGQRQLTGATFVVVTSGSALPSAELVADPATLATGGAVADALEGTLVRVENITVVDAAPTPGAGDAEPTNEYMVTGNLRVNDYLYHTSSPPLFGESLSYLAGILRHANDNKKLEPRSADDVGSMLQVRLLSPHLAYVDEGQTADALTVTLNRAAAGGAATVTLSASTSDIVVPSSVEIPEGQSTVSVSVTGVTASPGGIATMVTAFLNGSTAAAWVRVVGLTEEAGLSSLTTSAASTPIGDEVGVTVTLDIPARNASTVVTLSVDGYGTLSSDMLTIAQGQLSGDVTFTAGETDGTATITATLGSSVLTTQIVVVTPTAGRLVINEVDYDQVDADVGEFVEILNTGTGVVSLDGLALIAFNGNGGGETKRVALSGSLAGGFYAVVANPSVSGIDSAAMVFRFTADSDNLQNGAPDGVLLYDTVNLQAVDALSYEGAMPVVTPTGATAAVPLVEGTALSASVADTNTGVASLIRDPNGSDTDNATTDWKLTKTITPGSANVYTP